MPQNSKELKENLLTEYIYDQVHNNITEISSVYGNILENNSLMKTFKNDNIIDASTKTFTLLLLLNLQIQKCT